MTPAQEKTPLWAGIKNMLKLIVSAAFYYSGCWQILRLWNNLAGHRLTILMFHRVSDDHIRAEGVGLPTISLSATNFESLIEFILKSYKIISIDEYLRCTQNRSAIPYNSLMLTFDDGYKEVLENVKPVLKKHELPAVLFVPAAKIDAGGFFWWDACFAVLNQSPTSALSNPFPNDPSIGDHLKNMQKAAAARNAGDKERKIVECIEALQNVSKESRDRVIQYVEDIYFNSDSTQRNGRTVLNWDEIKELQAGGFAIGSHTVNHEFLTSMPEAARVYEIAHSKKMIEDRLQAEVASFSYPGGKYDEKTARLVEEAGYACALTTEEGINSPATNSYRLKRINIWDRKVCDHKGKFSKPMAAWNLLMSGAS